MTTLLQVASMQARWLAARQAVTAENVAQASTPGYVARDVTAFEDALKASAARPGQAATAADQTPWAVRPSGNSVSLEEEMIRGSSIQRSYSLNAGIVSAFHRMFNAAARG
jgi:flagellar basal-body rod protein FlgB